MQVETRQGEYCKEKDTYWLPRNLFLTIQIFLSTFDATSKNKNKSQFSVPIIYNVHKMGRSGEHVLDTK